MIRRSLLRAIELWQVNPRRPRGMCKYEPSCSHYAHAALTNRGLVVGFLFTAWRILRCNPFGRGGVDLPPPPRNSGAIQREAALVALIDRPVRDRIDK